MRPFWLSALLDLPAESAAVTTDFWAAVTGHPVSPRRGEHDEFASLVPPDGDDYLRMQRLQTGGPRLHLDVHVADPRGAADSAVERGARELSDRDFVVLASPAGLPFCLVSHRGRRVPGPRSWPGGSVSRVDQICLDLPRSVHDQERAFWSELLDAPVEDPGRRPEFTRITPTWSPLKVLVQRLDEQDGPARAHLDIATIDRPAETARHVDLGGRVRTVEEWWTVMEDPSGSAYCLTDRPPDPTG